MLSVFLLLVAGCVSEANHQRSGASHELRSERIERLVGEVDVVPPVDVLDKGRVLISYSDCLACHKETDRKRGPAFNDIAARYPMNSTYIQVLAKRVVLGNRGVWGSTVMPPHPTVSEEDAKIMVMYILSLD